MAITLDGTTGITAPGVTDTGNLSVTGTSTSALWRAVLDWEVGQWHGFTALEPNTRLVNIIKG